MAITRGNENERKLARSILAVQIVAEEARWRWGGAKRNLPVVSVVGFDKRKAPDLTGKCLLKVGEDDGQQLVMVDRSDLPKVRDQAKWRADVRTYVGSYMHDGDETMASFADIRLRRKVE